MTIFKKAGGLLARLCFNLIIVWLLLSWVDVQTEKRITAARAEGKALCEAEQIKKDISRLNKEKEIRKHAEIKKARIWASPNLDDDAILQLFNNGEL